MKLIGVFFNLTVKGFLRYSGPSDFRKGHKKRKE